MALAERVAGPALGAKLCCLTELAGEVTECSDRGTGLTGAGTARHRRVFLQVMCFWAVRLVWLLRRPFAGAVVASCLVMRLCGAAAGCGGRKKSQT